jgi:hypothetical protein
MTEPYEAPEPGQAPELYRAPEPGPAAEPYRAPESGPAVELYRAPESGPTPATYPNQPLYPAQEPVPAHLYHAAEPYQEAQPSEAPTARRAAPLVEEEDPDITSFAGTIGWTILGKIVPGLGFLKARRRGEGITTLIFFLAIVGGVGYLVYQRTFALKLMTSPITLLGVALLCGMLGILIIGSILATYFALRPRVITAGQRIAGGVLVVVLSFLLCLPLAIGAGYSLSAVGLVR